MVGKGVYISEKGYLQIGGGTSVYKDLSGIEISSSCPEHIKFSALLQDSMLMSYTDSLTGFSSLSVLDISNTNKVTTATTTSYYHDLYDIAVLDNDNGLFVAISQDISSTESTASIVAGRITSPDKTIYFGSSVLYGEGDVGEYSLDPRISRLSSTRFCVSYYETKLSGKSAVYTLYG
jgi:hypothetical protein